MKYLFKEELTEYRGPDGGPGYVFAFEHERDIERAADLPTIDGEMLAKCVQPYRLSDVYYFLKRHGSFWLCRFLFRTGLYKYVPGVKLYWYVDKPYGCYFG